MTAAASQFDRLRTAGLDAAILLRDRWMLSDRRGGRRMWPVRTAADESAGAREPFFLMGSPRSGTTLLRAIVSSHPKIFIPPENGAWRQMIRTFGARRGEAWDAVAGAVLEAFQAGYEFDQWRVERAALASGARAIPEERRSLVALIDTIYRAYGDAHAPGKPIWGDKSTPGGYRYLPKLALVYPRSRWIHIVRDGRACVASSLKAGFYGRDHEEASYAWRQNVRACRSFGQRFAGGGRFLEIRYEDLVSSTGEEIDRICAFLDIEPSEDMRHHDAVLASTASDLKAIGHHENVRRPVSQASLDKWRNELSTAQIGEVSRIVHAELKSYGYAA